MTIVATDSDLLAVARRYAARPEDWPFAPRFDPDRRWYARLGEHTGHEAWLLTWLPGQETDLHDHGGSAGAYVVVSGALTEHALVRRGVWYDVAESVLPAGAYRRFGADHVHRLGNAGPAPAVSVHVYGPALRAMNRYRLDGGELRLESVSQAGADW